MRFITTLIALLVCLPCTSAQAPDPHALSGRIDASFDEYWKKNDITPAPLADDAEFLRRASLDLVGVIPSVQEVRQFLADRDPKKREKAVAALVKRLRFSQFQANVFRQQWLPQTLDNEQAAAFSKEFETYLRKQLREGTGLDGVVRSMLASSPPPNQRIVMQNGTRDPAAAFMTINENKPENLAASVSRLFLGVKLECAQCHDHPLNNSIKRKDFWQLAAFFGPPKEKAETVSIEEAGVTYNARFPDGTEPIWDKAKQPREVFADWLLAKENPAFAKITVNRVWRHFFGLGLLDPIDEPADDNPALIPELEAELVRAFIASGYNLDFLATAIADSKVYQRASKQTHASQSNPRYFARANVRGLSGEQLYDSLMQASGAREAVETKTNMRNAISRRAAIIQKFSSPEALIERQTSILQALTLMNGKFLSEVTNPQDSEFLAGVADAPFLSVAGRIESLFLASLGRMPTKDELQKHQEFVEKESTPEGKRKAYGDIFWALLNSSEFMLNH